MPTNREPNSGRMHRPVQSRQGVSREVSPALNQKPELSAYAARKRHLDKIKRRKRRRLVCYGLFLVGLVAVLYGVTHLLKSTQSQPDVQPHSEATPAVPKETWALILANTQNPLPENYETTVTYVQGPTSEQQCDSRILKPLTAMMDAAAADGCSLYFRSGYRSFATQTYLFDAMRQDYMAQGMTEDEAYAATKKLRNIPGTSEHETGLAVDLVPSATPGIDLTQDLENTKEIQWLHAHCAEYGFILRYLKDKTDITGTSYEPWHFRYVGVDDAQKIMTSGITLEEYLAKSSK